MFTRLSEHYICIYLASLQLVRGPPAVDHFCTADSTDLSSAAHTPYTTRPDELAELAAIPRQSVLDSCFWNQDRFR